MAGSVFNHGRALELLRAGSGNPSADFRDGQLEAIQAVCEKASRVLVVQKTGWGKSFVYFISTLLYREDGQGPALLISPLLSLMRNQVAAAERMGLRAATVNSENLHNWQEIEEQVANGEVDLLLISPERLQSERFILGPMAGLNPSLVVIDEAYINYSRQKTFIQELTEYSNLVVLQTLSKAWGLAGLRIGMAFASEEIIEIFNKVKPPYNINEASQALALQALQNVEQVNSWIKETVAEREKLKSELSTLKSVLTIYPSDANFILVKTIKPKEIYQFMVNRGIIVRDRSKVELCEGCLRITIGTPNENEILIEAFKNFEE
jgi:histidinol-phosphate aminotransferase